MGTTGRTRRWSMAAALCASMLVVAGCTDDEPTDGSGNDPTSQTPSPSPSGSESDAPVEPEVPDSMANVDKAGAKAFVQYYWDVVAYAQVTGDVSTLRRLAFPTCSPCRAGLAEIRKKVPKAREIVGGEVTISRVRVMPLQGEPRPFMVRYTAENTRQKIVYKNGETETFDSAKNPYEFVVAMDEQGQWKVGSWELG